MNGIHDMGGMQDFGPIRPENNEPVFHARWEGRVLALTNAVSATGKFRAIWRVVVENLPPAEYLRMSYYERFIPYLVEGLIAGGLVTSREVETGKAARGSAKNTPALRAGDVAKQFAFHAPSPRRTEERIPRFTVGQPVRARNINPVGHTRLPRYARGRNGVIQSIHAVENLPDTSVYGRGANRQHVYSVRFGARELWGQQASSRDAVYLDLWEDYLEPA